MGQDVFEAIRQERAALSRELPFESYLEEVRADPRLARLAHARLHDMVVEAGVEAAPDARARYELFRDELFGADDAVRQVVDYLAAGARRLDMRKRILFIVGPPGSGKSTLVNALKRGLERYTTTPEGATYAIKGCPVQEDPLHLIPPAHRPALEGIHVEGDLCPYCRWLVREVYGGDIARVPVERVVFSEAEGVGIGTFVATDPGSEDLTRLVGQVDPTLLEGASIPAARRAFRLDGALNAANRGLADLVEIFKMDERFLSTLLTVSEERLLKVSGPGTMYADVVLVGESNLGELEAMVSEPKAAALLDRLVVVRVGYVLSVRDEVRIYEKMLRSTDLRGLHISPLALPTVATVAVLSRLAKTGGGLQRKLWVYDGRFVRDAGPGELERLRAAAPEEGLGGLSPRFMMTQLSNALAGVPVCLSGVHALEALWQGLSQRAAFREEEREAWVGLFRLAREEHDELVRKTIRRATVPGYPDVAEAMIRDGLRDLERWAGGTDERELRSLRRLEEALGVPGYWRTDLREEWLWGLRRARDRLGGPLRGADPRMDEAVELVLAPAWRDVAPTLTAFEDGSELARQDRDLLRGRLVAQEGFCEACAEDVLSYAIRLARPRRERRARGPKWLAG